MTENEPTEEFRYLYTVRQRFGDTPIVDSFYELTVPAGITGEQARVMTKLNEKWCRKEIANDSAALDGMRLRLRFNMDMFQHVCLVRAELAISVEELELVIQGKYNRGTLQSFLEGSAV